MKKANLRSSFTVPNNIVKNIGATFPQKFMPLLPKDEDIRYRISYGGRVSGKSTSTAMALLLRGVENPIRVLCAREHQTTMKESVHKTLVDAINILGLESFYQITNTTIVGKEIPARERPGNPNVQTEFIFMGIANNPHAVKSTQGITIGYIEEADTLSEESWRYFDPTIRRTVPGQPQEIWMCFNPQYDTDFVYKTFIANDHPNSRVIKLNYLDNPFIDKAQVTMASAMKAMDYAEYENVWLGETRQHFEGAVYDECIEEAKQQGRIGEIEYTPGFDVELFFDIGYSDSTACWACQKIGNKTHFIDYYESRKKDAAHFVSVMSNRGYPVRRWNLPHDGKNHGGGSNLTWEGAFRAAGKSTRVLKNKSILDGINAARIMFSTAYFDEKRCAEGLNCLRHYRFAVKKDGDRVESKPVHDRYSNGSDSFRYAAMGLKERTTGSFPKFVNNGGSWMGRGDAWMSL